MADQHSENLLRSFIEAGVLTAEQATDVLEKVQAGSDLRSIILDEGLVEEEVYVRADAQLRGLAFVDLKKTQIPRDVLVIIPESTAREHSIIAYEETEEELKVGMIDPADRQIIEFVGKKVDKPVTVALATDEGMKAALALYRRSLDLELQEIFDVAQISPSSTGDLSEAAQDLPVVRITDLVLKHAILQDVSDIHIEPTETEVIIRYRIDGILQDVINLPRDFLAGLVARIKVLSKLKIDEHRLPQDGRFKIESDDYKVAFRVSILPVYDGEKIVMRLLDESGKGLDLDSIGMSEKALEVFRRNVHKPNGMILVTGPTGSGKTTTLYATIRELNTPEVNISTVEDPVEYRMPRINQTQVNSQIGLTFSNGLRSLVRQDPDILMVGEIRDEETASLAVNAALTGHLVLSTLHTNSAAGALPRLLDMAVEAFLMASTVNILLGQRLVRRLCQECKKEVPLETSVLDDLKAIMDVDATLATLEREGVVKKGTKWSEVKVFEPVGCDVCSTGYKGRLGIYEVLEFTDEIREMITPTTSSDDLETAAREQQEMVSMLEDGFIKVVKGNTTVEEVLRVAKE